MLVAAVYGLGLDINLKERLKSLPAVIQRLLIQLDPIGNAQFAFRKTVVPVRSNRRMQVDSQSLRIEPQKVKIEHRVNIRPQDQSVAWMIVGGPAIRQDVGGLQEGFESAVGYDTFASVPMQLSFPKFLLSTSLKNGSQYFQPGIDQRRFVLTRLRSGSGARPSVLDTGGGRSQVSHLTTAATVLLVLLFLTKPLSYLPNVVLAAIVFLIGVKLIDRRGLADLYQKAPGEFALAAVTAATVVLVGVEQGILLAVVLSLLQHVRRSYRPHMAVILRDDVDHWRMEQPVPGKMLEPGLVMFWFGADLFYANAALFTAKARQLVEESPSPVRWLAIDAGAITGIDFSGASALAELQQDLAKNGVVLALARFNVIAGEKAEVPLKRLGLIKSIGRDRIFSSRSACVEAYRTQSRT